MSTLDPLKCGFAKLVTFEYLTGNLVQNQNVVPTENAKGSNLKETYEELQFFYGKDYFKINYTTFRSKYPSIFDQILSIGKRIPDVKKKGKKKEKAQSVTKYYGNFRNYV